MSVMLFDFNKNWTIGTSIIFEGVGLHSGHPVKMTLEPNQEAGINFIYQEQKIPALVDYVSDTRFCTRLTCNGVTVSTVEHILSALYGKGISAVNIYLTAGECPIMDGSSWEFAEQLAWPAGIRELASERQFLSLSQSVEVCFGDAYIHCSPADEFEVDYVLDYEKPQRLYQEVNYRHDSQSAYIELSRARTFGFASEVQYLKGQGLALGGSLENALVIGESGFFLNSERCVDECARHKILDLMGDFSLLGKTLKAKVFAYKAGHTSHVKMVRRLLE